MPKPVGTVNFSAVEVRALRELAAAGITRVEAARRLGRSHSTVVRQVQQMRLEWIAPPRTTPRRRMPPSPSAYAWTVADDEWLLALHAAGWTQGMASNEMNRPHGTVWRKSKKLGIEWPRSGKSIKGAPVKPPVRK